MRECAQEVINAIFETEVLPCISLRAIPLSSVYFLENATDRGRDRYKLLDAPVLSLDVILKGRI